MNYYASDVALRNNKENGYWIIIDNLVYDISGFVEKHLGGHTILMNNSGRDATNDFMKVQHHKSSRISASLKKYHIGQLLHIKFDLDIFQTLYKKWLENTFLIIEVQNTWQNDFFFIEGINTYNESPDELTPYKIDLLLETQSRFINEYLSFIFSKVNSLKISLNETNHYPYQSIKILNIVKDIITLIHKENSSIRGERSAEEISSWHSKMLAFRYIIEEGNAKLLSDIKHQILSGLKLLESSNIEKHYTQLPKSLNTIEKSIIEYLESFKREAENLNLHQAVI